MSSPKTLEVARCAVVQEDFSLLAVRRPLDSRNNPGKWECPGGKVDPGETLYDAAIRETFEETGYLVKPVSNPVLIHEYRIADGKYAGRIYQAFGYLAVVIGGALELRQETIAATWQPKPTLIRSPAITTTFRGLLRRTPDSLLQY